MTYHCGCGRQLRLWEDPETPPSDRAWLWIVLNAQDDRCWHRHHETPVVTCLRCATPAPLSLEPAA